MPNGTASPPLRVLVFSKTSGYRHKSIPAGIAGFRSLGARTGHFSIDSSEDAEAAITPDSLAGYAAVVFLHCSGEFLSAEQLAALKAYVRGGGGFVGVHCAAAGMPEDAWYGRLVGAHFDFHPPAEEGSVVIEDPHHFITAEAVTDGADGPIKEKSWFDEWYNFTTHPRSGRNVHVLVTGKEGSFHGGTMGKDHPLAWCQEFEGGRSFYTALGHYEEAYVDDWYMGQVLRAILWTARAESRLS